MNQDKKKGFKGLFIGAIAALENSGASFSYFILTFLFATCLRNFLEVFSDKDSAITPGNFLHYDLSYAAVAILFILLLHIAARTPVAKTARVVLPAFLVLCIVPVLDLALSGGLGYNIAYLSPEKHGNIRHLLLTFFGPIAERGVSPGIRVEVGLALLGAWCYIFVKTGRWLRSFFYTLVAYLILFFYLAFPYVIEPALNILGLRFLYSNEQFTGFYLLVILLAGVPALYLADREKFRVIIADIRPARLAHYLLMTALGVALGSNYHPLIIFSANPFRLLFIAVGIAFAWLFSVMTNNLADETIDRVSNPNRPLVKEAFPRPLYTKLAWGFFFLALLYGGAAHFRDFFLIAVFIAAYFLYSMPPLRLKRIPFFSKLVISGNSFLLFLLGFMSTTGSHKELPWAIPIFFLTIFTAAVNFIDIKDYAGDKAVGIKTLPVLLGLEKAKLLIAFFFFLCYIGLFIVLPRLLMLPVLLSFGLAQFFLIKRKNYREGAVLAVYLSSLLLLLIYIIATGVRL